MTWSCPKMTEKLLTAKDIKSQIKINKRYHWAICLLEKQQKLAATKKSISTNIVKFNTFNSDGLFAWAD